MDINQLALKVATFESRILLLESKLVVSQSQIAAMLKTDADLTNTIYAQEGEILQAQAKLK